MRNLVSTLFCVMLTVESVAQIPVLSLNDLLNNMLQFKGALTELKATVKELVENKEKSPNTTGPEKRHKVAFEVQSSEPTSVGLNEPFKFDHVALNTGNAYNPKSGIFLVPVNGTYFLWANVMTGHGNQDFDLGLFREGKRIAKAFTGRHMHFGTATINHVVKLKKGDHVWFAITHHSTDIFGSKISCYGGILMYE